ncbi:hypothetical protein Rsub_04058 [Raphidocelis subcapitata]|uniref:TFIIB-type domain-containing protein n=1 Tax=Raphidocelis subcapitata TaxID=307507 RepID=A0A2V0NVT7_9CHLO|nr:hypothetical protein Rsub_04058 [Raphidocelis subcapitata]|eukprot:GBF91754.1 hypothetical protein Rsub_04058 [Raphidocelis subcapitata]
MEDDDDEQPLLPPPSPRGGAGAGADGGGGAGAAAADGVPFCPACGTEPDEVEEVAGELICMACGLSIDAAPSALVHQRALPRAGDADGPAEGTGFLVAEGDTGAVAAAMLRGPGAPRGARAGPSAPDVRAHQAALAAGAGAARLPAGAVGDAAELVPLVMKAFSDAGRYVMQATMAATAYLAARNLTLGTSLTDVAVGFGVTPLEVGRHYLTILKLMGSAPPPPRLDALIVRHASVLLPRTFPEHDGPLRGHPVVRHGRQLGELMGAVDALSGRNPALAAAALLSLGYCAHGGARPSAAAADVAALLGFDRHAVRQHAKDFEAELARLSPLLPFAAGAGVGQLVPHVPLLLRLNAVVARLQAGGGSGGGGGEGAPAVGPGGAAAAAAAL